MVPVLAEVVEVNEVEAVDAAFLTDIELQEMKKIQVDVKRVVEVLAEVRLLLRRLPKIFIHFCCP